jgi:hypothetical protein
MLLEDNTQENPSDHGCDNGFLDTPLKVWSIKERTEELDLKLKTSVLQKILSRE